METASRSTGCRAKSVDSSLPPGSPVTSPAKPEVGWMADSEAAPRRVALLVATSTYDDPGLARLVSPAKDAAALADVLAAPRIGDFEVSSMEDATSGEIGQRM